MTLICTCISLLVVLIVFFVQVLVICCIQTFIYCIKSKNKLTFNLNHLRCQKTQKKVCHNRIFCMLFLFGVNRNTPSKILYFLYKTIFITFIFLHNEHLLHLKPWHYLYATKKYSYWLENATSFCTWKWRL